MAPALSPNALNVLTMLLLYLAREYFPDTFGKAFSGELTPFPEYMAVPQNAKNVNAGFAELWKFAGLDETPGDPPPGGPKPDLKLVS